MLRLHGNCSLRLATTPGRTGELPASGRDINTATLTQGTRQAGGAEDGLKGGRTALRGRAPGITGRGVERNEIHVRRHALQQFRDLLRVGG